MRKRLFIVGNGRLPFDLSRRVDGSDHVIRFNEPKESIGLSGSRTDWLFVMNSSNPMQRRIENEAYWTSQLVKEARLIILAYHPDIIRRYIRGPALLSRLKGRRSDWTWQTLRKFGEAGKDVLILAPQVYEQACHELGFAARTKVVPSTGFLALTYALPRFPQNVWDVEIAGFSWEGWKRHPWGSEADWVRAKSAERSMRVWMMEQDENEPQPGT